MNDINQTIDFQKLPPVQEAQPTQKEKNIFKHLFFISIFVFLIVITIIIIFFTKDNKTISKNNSNNQTENESTSPTTIVNNVPTESVSNIDINQIYQQAIDIAKSYEYITISLTNNFGTVWTTNDDKTIFINTTNTNFQLYNDCLKEQIYQGEENKSHPEVYSEITSKLENLLISNGFSLNSKNTTIKDGYEFKSYESSSGNYKCVIYFTNQCFGDSYGLLQSSFSFNCFSNDQLGFNYQQQIPFIQDLSYKDDFISNIKIKGDEAILYTSDRGRMENYHINPSLYSYKANNKWNYIFSGNDVCSCEDLIKQKVPKEHWVGCEDKNNNFIEGSFSLE